MVPGTWYWVVTGGPDVGDSSVGCRIGILNGRFGAASSSIQYLYDYWKPYKISPLPSLSTTDQQTADESKATSTTTTRQPNTATKLKRELRLEPIPVFNLHR